MTATDAPAQRRPADRRDLILGAASDLFSRHGFDGVSMADIAENVGVTAPALYRHFANKKDLLVSVVGDTVDRLDRVIADTSNTDEPLRRCIERLVAEVLDHPSQVVTYLRERHRLDGEEARTQSRRERRYLDTMGDLIGSACPDVPSDERAVRAVGAVGVLRGFAERAPALGRPRLDEFVAHALLDMLTAPPTPPATTRTEEGGGWSPEASPRERVLRAALPLFRERGFGGVAMGEIGEAAGVGASNVRRYVESKEEILVDLYDRVGAQVEVDLDRAIRSADSPADALERMIRTYCSIAFDATDLVVVVTQNRRALPASDRPRLRRRDRRNGQLWRAVVSEVRPDLRPNEVATLSAGILPFINMYPQQQLIAVPHPDSVAPLVQAYVLGSREP